MPSDQNSELLAGKLLSNPPTPTLEVKDGTPFGPASATWPAQTLPPATPSQAARPHKAPSNFGN